VTRSIRIAYLGPPGTFSEDALRAALGDGIEAVPEPSVHEAVLAVEAGEVERALVPFENSIEGAVRATLDTLAFDTTQVAIVGEYDFPIRHSLIAGRELDPESVSVVLSHPQASAQCARFIRDQLPRAEVRGVASTAEAVRRVSETDAPWAALGTTSAARIYDCVVLRDGVEDEPDNVTRFVWIAPAGTEPRGDGPWRTTLVFSELGDDRPGALVDALKEFSSREVNLTRIESRPLRRGLGRYMFFIDLEGGVAEEKIDEAIEGLKEKAESVRVLGSYPVSDSPIKAVGLDSPPPPTG
jgi:prephenate dehydratase